MDVSTVMWAPCTAYLPCLNSGVVFQLVDRPHGMCQSYRKVSFPTIMLALPFCVRLVPVDVSVICPVSSDVVYRDEVLVCDRVWY